MKSWSTLVVLGRVVKQKPPGASEVKQRIQIAGIVLADSRVEGLSAGRRFQILYETAYRWCEIVMRVEGWRTKGEGHHESVISAFSHFVGKDAEKLARYLDRCRRRRNVVSYGVEYPPITDGQVERLASAVIDLESLVKSWLESKHPDSYAPENHSH